MPTDVRTTDIAAIRMSRATYDTISRDWADIHTLIPIPAPAEFGDDVPYLQVWVVDDTGRVLRRQHWRDGELVGGGP